ncbi:MAG: hypothetical protein ACK5QC_15120 [Bacteroidota bacterium]
MNLINFFKKDFNPKTFDEGLLARYPNNTKLVDTKTPDINGNTNALMTEEGKLLIAEKFSGVVYIDNKTYEVYSGKDDKKSGIFKIGEGVNWDCLTPRQIVNKAHKDFLEALNDKFSAIRKSCPCSYPRIIDYISRGSTEGFFLSQRIRDNYLTIVSTIYDSSQEIETNKLNCKVCHSEFEWKHKERGIDSLILTKNNCKIQIGKDVNEYAPNFIDALTDKVFCNQSFLYRQKLVESDLEITLNYLFEEK